MRKEYKGYLFSVCSLAVLLIGMFGTHVAFAKGQELQASFQEVTPLACSSLSIVASPNRGASDNQLFGVATTSTSDAWAVGYYTNSSMAQTLIEHWNGMSWSLVSSPNAGSKNSILYSVAATSAGDVWAVGESDTGSSNYQTLIEHWNGTSWSVVSSPNPGLDYNFLYGVSAVSASDVWAVGNYYNSSISTFQTLIEHWNGTSWSVVASPNNGSLQNELFSVKAASSSDVWTVGYFYSSSINAYQTLVEHWNGTSWKVTPNPQAGSLYGVSASSASNVWTVGDYTNSSLHVTQTLVEHWNGTSWSVVSSPNIGSLQNELVGVSAVSASDVWAVGDYYNNSSGFLQTLVEQWNGTGWSVVSSPNADTNSNVLTSVAATSASNVWAVGYYYDSSSGKDRTLIESHC